MRTVIMVELVIDGEINDAVHVIDGLLDNGVFQDPINGHDADCGPLKVLSARIVGPTKSQDASALRFCSNMAEKAIGKVSTTQSPKDPR